MKMIFNKRNILILKLIISITIIAVIFFDIDPDELKFIFNNSNKNYMILALLLLPVNIFLQFAKWKYLISKVSETKTSSKLILTSVFLGISFGFITPGKVGELGKLFVIRNVDKMKLLSMSILEKIYDVLPVIAFGVISIPFLPHLFFTDSSLMQFNLLIITMVVAVIIIFILLHPGLIKLIVSYVKNNFFSKSTRFVKFNEGIQGFTKTNARTLSLFSLALFLVYTSQFVLLIFAFGEIAIHLAYIGVWSAMLIKTFLPISLGDIGVREGTAAYVFGLMNFPKEAAVSAGFMLFVINILIPASVGVFLIPFARFVKGYLKNGKDKTT
ncbi:MAG: lysylphosphatidylglycerol synthase transmembrane domain-containing protein [Candidatus Delongbacteria bacterium]|nr:lysylphosphatidylglycerol synthase transmembrane domain-containing protein [Candidatus Delongbacteria bacterium]